MIDYIIIGIIVFSALVSLWRGFIREVMSLAGWVLAFFVASYFYPYLSVYLMQVDSIYLQQSEYLRNGIAATALLIGTLIVMSVVNALLGKLVEKTGLSGTDRVLGIVFGGLRGVLIIAALLFFLDSFTQANQTQWWKESQLIPHFGFIVKWFFEQLQANSSLLK
ncbi:CvpA family protein [Phocoenobacter skyensis]|uniref:CvpA family protein n=1 Tax=Phocoenobacter skyensis TaxID=97481 RepID=A0A1H7Z4P5_9PAST|nr:CvpA family protein [Pasteurella skyensis]MDP8080151.1 CvpA family protein [Pasteurella skyensis]MDP8086157.1 CvpA family protein [Pasteurella skyensis]MDP8163357.1 CvpA family protein [Pasteurella skyensis]MDP8171141.1 CvpA family protein [Pasteurella skyensis]MDP8173586.1 CvpA family protein [Pasteurella skyensis]